MWDMSQDKNKLFERYLLEGGSQDYADRQKPQASKTQGLRENRKFMKLF